MQKYIQKVFCSVLVLFCLVSLGQAQKLDMKKLKGMQARNIGPGGMSGRVTSIDAVHTQTPILFIAGQHQVVYGNRKVAVLPGNLFSKKKK